MTTLNINWENNISNKNINLIEYIELNSDEIRLSYIKLINQAKENIFKRNSFFLKFSNKLDLFELSTICEKSFYKSPDITRLLKLISIKKIIESNSNKLINIYYNENWLPNNISYIIKNKSKKINLIKVTNKKNYKSDFRKKLLRCIPNYIKGILYILIQYIKFFKLKNNRFSLNNFNEGILFFSYFVHIDYDLLNKEIFHSYQWCELPHIFNNKKIDQIWLHQFVKDNNFSGFKDFNEKIDKINNNSYQKHFILEEFFSFDILLRVIFNFTKYYISLLFNFHFRRHEYSYLFKILKDDYNKSFFGTVLANNLLQMQLIENFLSSIPKQRVCFYLFENQSWEKILLYFWRKHNHGKIYGYLHSYARYWDLRYLYKIEHFNEFVLRNEDYFPDKILINNINNFEYFKSMGIDPNCLEKIEAFRYESINKKLENKNKSSRKILLLTDYQESINELMLKYLENVFSNEEYEFALKEHPANIVKTNLYSKIKITKTNERIENIYDKFDICFVAGASNASLDLFVTKIKIFIFVDNNQLNFSPLRGNKNINFINNKTKKEMLFTMLNEKLDYNAREKFFFFSDNHRHWKNFLKNEIVSSFKNSSKNLNDVNWR